jgi:hypothetical protein
MLLRQRARADAKGSGCLVVLVSPGVIFPAPGHGLRAAGAALGDLAARSASGSVGFPVRVQPERPRSQFADVEAV